MKKEWALCAFGLMLLAAVDPLAADVLGRKKMERRFDQAGDCHLPYREYRLDNTFGPITTPLHFTAASSSATIIIEVQNRLKDEWFSNSLDKFLVLKRSVFENDSLWKPGGCVTGAYFDFSLLGDTPSIVYKELFTNGPGEWTGVGTDGVYWGNGVLILGHQTDPDIISTSVTVENLEPGEEYTLSFWWQVSVPFAPVPNPTLTATVLDTPQLSNFESRSDSISGSTPLASWDYYYVDVPAAMSTLSFNLDFLTDDADLYIRRGERPDADSYDCSSIRWDNTKEECSFTNPEPGRWWIGVANFDSNVTIDYTIWAEWQEPIIEVGQDFYTIPPCRTFDTRGPGGSPLSSGTTYWAFLAGFCGVPRTAKAVSVNITVVGATGSGNLKLWPGHIAEPPTSTINFAAGVTRANSAIVGLGTDEFSTCLVKPFVAGNGTVHLIIDVSGYFQ